METIVIIGGGAGGLELATRLGNRLGRRHLAKIVLVDRMPTHFWKPLLHAVASGKLDPHTHQIEYAAQAADHYFEFICGEVTSIDRHGRTVTVSATGLVGADDERPLQAIGYDKLVLAFGAVTNFFGVEGAARHSLTLDSVYQAEVFRKRVIMHCVHASNDRASGRNPQATVDIVIVGGGATGVELAAELSHTVRTLAKYNVHALDPKRDIHIRIVERGTRLLPHLDATLAAAAARHLHRLGVNISTTAAVESVEADAVVTDGARFASSITLWAAGVEGPRLCASLGLSLNRTRQILVGPTLQAIDDPAIFAIGDCASFVCPVKGTAVPPRAQVAHQQAVYLAGALCERSDATVPQFVYHDHGSLISLGSFAAVGVLNRASSVQGVFVGGLLARVLYGLMYQKHVVALQGVGHMIAQTVAIWLRKKLSPSVKLH
ncbi:MAG: FAD-dependent oxidoreductase [Herminiimonas sp.]|nr:FAD-dependent oxidoreductase [Herminiimonas sp.]